MGQLLVTFCVVWAVTKIFWCDLAKSYAHGCPACWLVRSLATVALAMYFST
jgi:hypothetical protein